MSLVTYKVCSGATVAELETEVQTCLDLSYSLIGDTTCTSVIDSADVITNLFLQSVRKVNQ